MLWRECDTIAPMSGHHIMYTTPAQGNGLVSDLSRDRLTRLERSRETVA